MTSILKKVHVDKVDDLVNKYSNTYHRTIKMKPADVKSKTYIEFNRENNNKVRNHVIISKHKNLVAKSDVLNWSVKVFVIEEIKNNVTWAYINGDLNGEKIIGKSYKKELQKINQKQFRDEQAMKRKDDRLYVKQKGQNYSFNSWIDQN